ncbi:MAG: hypothetical protein COA36_17540 [Desulfotalea sp.]|nr:MAG: hypothetical protein COA36_17540 [Desulfotalea sp.]
MLFPYKYVPHTMDRMQRFINFIFYQVWCRAYKAGAFRLELFDGNPDLKEVMKTFYYSDNDNAYFFYGHIERIYGMFATLPRADIKQFKRWYQGNNNVEKVCDNDPALHLARYADLPPQHEVLSKQLASFFTKLYDNVDIAAFKKKIGKIDDHYKAFMRENTVGKCPFCGLSDMLGANHTPREAYDHYLPKKLYPFNSINFRNLVPACHHCNSSYKTTKDPAFNPKDPTRATHRRKVFYPYANSTYNIELTIDFSKPDVDHLTTNDIQLAFGPPILKEEIETWKDVYSIEERYKAKCCSGDAKDWLEQIRILQDEHGIAPGASLNTLQRQTAVAPFANSNFLKKAFLEGCQRVGLI